MITLMKSLTVYLQIFSHVHSTVDGLKKTPHCINLTSDFRQFVKAELK